LTARADDLQVKVAAVLALLVFLAGCGGSSVHRSSPPVTPRAWTSVVTDWFDDTRIDNAHSCAAVIEAYVRVQLISFPSPTSTSAFRTLRSYARSVCTPHGSTEGIDVGTSDSDVARAAGFPRSIRGSCLIYTELRVCLENGRVSNVQHIEHG
jgi:hypothetical protein